MPKISMLALVLPVVLLGCVTMSSDARFLVEKLDDQSKADALTTEGIDQYQVHLLARQELDRVPEIRQYFVVALHFDPGNVRAKQYLALVDNYKSQQLVAQLKIATQLMAKARRSDDEDYTLLVAVASAARLDPEDSAVQTLLEQTASDRARLAGSYLEGARAALDAAAAAAAEAARAKQYGLAYQVTGKVLAMDPGNAEAQRVRSTAWSALVRMETVRAASIRSLITAGRFVEALSETSALGDLNRTTGNLFAKDMASLGYALNLAWAQDLYGRKDYAMAGAKVDAALRFRESDEARSLQARIAAARGKTDSTTSFDAELADLDRLLDAKEVVAAHTKLEALSRAATDPGRRQLLDGRSARVQGDLKDLYERGVQAYQSEDFKTAIELLRTVVSIQVDYGQASDYLDRATSKQKLLDSY